MQRSPYLLSSSKRPHQNTFCFWDVLSLPAWVLIFFFFKWTPQCCPNQSENRAKGHDRDPAQVLLPFPESRRGWVPMQMLLLSSSSSGGRLRSSQAHLALTPLRFEPSVSIPLSTLSCLKRSKTPRLFWVWLDPEPEPTLAPCSASTAAVSSSYISPSAASLCSPAPGLWYIS